MKDANAPPDSDLIEVGLPLSDPDALLSHLVAQGHRTGVRASRVGLTLIEGGEGGRVDMQLPMTRAAKLAGAVVNYRRCTGEALRRAA